MRASRWTHWSSTFGALSAKGGPLGGGEYDIEKAQALEDYNAKTKKKEKKKKKKK